MKRIQTFAIAFLIAGCTAHVEPSVDIGEAGAPSTPACDQAAALEAYRAEHNEVSAVGEWTVSPDCVVTQVLP